jgi:hypothetical protein
LSSIARLSNEVNDISATTPARDQKTYAEAIKALNTKLQEVRNAFAPKPKFAFKSRLRLSEKKNESAISLNDSAELDDQKQQKVPGSVPDSLSGDSGVHARASNLPPPILNSIDSLEPALTGTTTRTREEQDLDHKSEEIRHKPPPSNQSRLEVVDCDGSYYAIPPEVKYSSGTVAKIRDSIVNLSRQDSGSANSGEQPAFLAALTLKDIRRSLILCGKVAGAVHLTDIHDSVIVLQSRQFRMHDSTNCRIYLKTSSRPIIEDCGRLQFAPAPRTFLYATEANGAEVENDEDGLWANVDDFKWLKPEPSPNWSKLPSGERLSPSKWEALLGPQEDIRNVLQSAGVPL